MSYLCLMKVVDEVSDSGMNRNVINRQIPYLLVVSIGSQKRGDKR